MRIRKTLVILLALLVTTAVGAAVTFEWERTTNVYAYSGSPDGVHPGGDRENSYAWSMYDHKVQDVDYLYVGSNRDLIPLALMNSGLTREQMQQLFGNDVKLDISDLRARVFRFRSDGTGPWEQVYISPARQTQQGLMPQDIGYRGAMRFDDDLYLVSMGSLWGHTRVLQFPADGSGPNEVLRIAATSAAATLRPIAVYDNHLVVGTGTNDIFVSATPQVQPPGIGQSTQGWTQVASVEDFGLAEPGAVGGLWEFESFNGHLYVSIGKNTDPDDEANNGFRLFKGRPVSEEVLGRNQFGWEWTCVVGPGGRYPRGLGKGANAAVSLRTFRDHLYMGTFQDFAALAGSGDFDYLVSHMNPCQIYRMDASDRVDMVIGDRNNDFPARHGNYGGGFYNISGAQALAPEPINRTNMSMNQYMWWMDVHQDRLYVSTFDIRTFLRYITPANLAMFGMDPDQIEAVMQRIQILEQFNDNPPGFDLYCSQDGINFAPVTRDGFGDPYNYGGRTLRATGQGLFVGTANPFWGCQVYNVNARVTPDPTGGSGGGACFVATAAFGSPMAAQVDTLRSFRDRYLLPNAPGRDFVAWYYQNGPVGAAWMEAHPASKPLVRLALYPAVGVSWLAVNGLLGPTTALAVLLAAWALVRRRLRTR